MKYIANYISLGNQEFGRNTVCYKTSSKYFNFNKITGTIKEIYIIATWFHNKRFASKCRRFSSLKNAN